MGECYVYPTYMVKDGKEFFMFNRISRQHNYEDNADESESHKKLLISTNGKYFKFRGCKDDPLEMLKIAAKRKLHFINPEDLWWHDRNNKYMDFNGEFVEISSSFHYRIYDVEFSEKIKEAATKLIEEKWDEV